MLRLDMNLVFTVINLIIFYIGIRCFLIKPISNILEKRQNEIEQNENAAKAARQEALSMKKDYEESMSNASQDADKIMERARQEAKEEYARIVKTAEEDAVKKQNDAQQVIMREREKTIMEMKGQITELAMHAADKILLEKCNPAKDAEIYDQFLKDFQ